MQCSHCSSTDFRLSTFHRADIARLLRLQYPMRCRDCHERLYGGVFFALGLRRFQTALPQKGHRGSGASHP